MNRKAVRVAGNADLPHIYDIELKCYEYPLNHEQLRELFYELPRVVPVAAREGNRVISWGYGIAHEDDLEIKRIATLPEYRFRGHATAVLGEIWKQAARTYRCDKDVYIMVPEYQTLSDDPDCAVGFLHALGFKATSVEPDYFHRYGRPYDGIKFSRRM